MRQPTLFEKPSRQSVVDVEQVVLYALGDFQARGKILANRDLPLDRLRGALRRAAAEFKCDELTDEVAVSALESLGTEIRRVPTFVAKHPFRVLVSNKLADRARRAYGEALTARKRGTNTGELL